MTPEQKERLTTIQDHINHALEAKIHAQKMVHSARSISLALESIKADIFREIKDTENQDCLYYTVTDMCDKGFSTESCGKECEGYTPVPF